MNELDLSASPETDLKYMVPSGQYTDIDTISQNTQNRIIYCLWLQVDLTVLNESFKRLMEKVNIHFRTKSYPGEE